MRLRDSVALTLPSFLLRLVLGITFIWAGCGKLLGTLEVSGDNAARLANLGVVLVPVGPGAPGGEVKDPAPTPTTQDPANTPTPSAPLESLPGAQTPPAAATPSAKSPESLKDQAKDIINTIKDKANQGTTTTPAAGSPTPAPPAASGQESDKDTVKLESLRPVAPMARGVISRVQYSGDHFAGSDFPDLVQSKRVHSITLMISKAADPGLTPDSQPIPPIMPSSLANAPWPVVMAWSAAITELAAGTLLVLGLLTRLSALGTFSVMLVAMWMTQFGPAALHSNDAILGFIPRADDLFSPAAYSTLFWQLALASMSLAVVFLGSGVIGIDRLLFSGSPRDPYVHGDPKAAPRTGKGGAQAAGPSRSEFDRSPNPTP